MPPSFDARTGRLREPSPDLRIVEDPEIVRLKGALEAAERQIQDLQRELTKKLGRIRSLMEDKEREREAYVRREEVELWFEVWRIATKHPNSKLGPARFDAIRQAIELDYTIEQWTLVCEFAGRLPFGPHWARRAHGKESERKDSPELDLVKRFETFARQEWEYRQQSA
jgi:hypothetical protein